jgi:hypothetical protein
VDQRPVPARFDAGVLGGAVYLGRWRAEARASATEHTATLLGRPVWLFASGPVGQPPHPGRGLVPHQLVSGLVAAREHRFFPGWLARDGRVTASSRPPGPMATPERRRLIEVLGAAGHPAGVLHDPRGRRPHPHRQMAAGSRAAVVAFEVDDYDLAERTGWNVTVVGPSRLISDPDRIRELDRHGVRPRAPASSHCYVAHDGGAWPAHPVGRRTPRSPAAGSPDGLRARRRSCHASERRDDP